MNILTKELGTTDYSDVFEKMKNFTINRTSNSSDEIWITEHNPVFTQGQAGKKEHILTKTDIPIIQSDRGGQVTYHGEGQLLIYTLIDLKRAGIGIREMISLLEGAIIEYLNKLDILAYSKKDAPGVYINNEKIASVGLRVKNGRTYHGISFNVDMDLKPFLYINPCGYSGLKMTQLKEHHQFNDKVDVGREITSILITNIKNKQFTNITG